MVDLPPFMYSALSAREIRVLVPDGPDPRSGLSWSLKTVDIDDKSPQFTALSYAWASDSHPDTFPISCNGCQLRVHYNLYTALPFLARQYQNESVATPYWIDAICINQTDDEEKIFQIRLMNTIYRQANRVLIWLGLALKPEWQNLIPRAIELLPLLIKECARCRQSTFKYDLEVDRELSHLGRDGWEAILHLLRNTYFRRVWMVQEVALAKELVFLCGDHEIDPQLIEKAVFGSCHIGNWAIYDLSNGGRMRVQAEPHDDSIIFAIRNIVKYHGEEGNAHQTIRIINLLDNQTCFAPQDRVLGILGMVQEEFGDASKDLHMYTSIADLYTRFSTLLFEASGLTKVHWWYYLSMAFNLKRIERLPSWVPDLHNNDAKSKRQPYESMLAARIHSDPPWQASSRPRVAAHGPQPGEIVLRGKLLDEVTLVHAEVPHFPEYSHPNDVTGMMWMAALIDLIRWESKIADAVIYNATEEIRILEDTYWRTLLADFREYSRSNTSRTRETWLQFREAGQHFLRLVPRLEELKRYVARPQNDALQLLINSSKTGIDPWDLPDWTDCEEERATVHCFRDPGHPVANFMANLRLTRDHQLINTTDGRFGFTCTGVRPGDVVCVFNDSVSPFVLRRVEDRNGEARYMFVGDAYVHKLMYGEADSMDIVEEDIVLV